ncbi:MAG: cell division ATP-binding protein FtsE [Coriobacteriales bacterium]|nr:cell division ATP-binding protein FtsE [Coriobacteriales bacterium]
MTNNFSSQGFSPETEAVMDPFALQSAQYNAPQATIKAVPLSSAVSAAADPMSRQPQHNTQAMMSDYKTFSDSQATSALTDVTNADATAQTAAFAAYKSREPKPSRKPMPGSKPVVLFENVSKVYTAQPDRPALSNVSLSIAAGDFVFLVGHSGSGKSTFIRLINREFVATSGKIYVAGEELRSMRRWRVPYLRRNIGCVFQDFKLLPNKSAFENVAFALEVIGKSKHIIRTQVPEVLRLVGLEDKMDKLPDQLSGGEQQRVSIARAIVNRPPMLICDEPTGNLDPQTSLGIMRLLDRINRTGTTIVVATHDREMVDSMRKRVVALENGYLVRDMEKGVYGIDA